MNILSNLMFTSGFLQIQVSQKKEDTAGTTHRSRSLIVQHDKSYFLINFSQPTVTISFLHFKLWHKPTMMGMVHHSHFLHNPNIPCRNSGFFQHLKDCWLGQLKFHFPELLLWHNRMCKINDTLGCEDFSYSVFFILSVSTALKSFHRLRS